ncbi:MULTISPECIES: hypothetical protein [Ramlibacter]|uniref:DUF2946 domain-containing protein n=1 Tax=Ramlibacter pinisoli TaxID=2682844 RepID=A0A6N8J131_9BURK|nr:MULTISPECIES: hypothetical protein [Ramlibacter]MBA2962030.1 hypothetical protein [Ramlibacter sp. CGMCC 1.13660]MVQ31973.1 hypothetical protein [Ramlibacter pinisoli]
MLRLRAHRLTTTFLVVLSLLFAQFALANYVCPQPAQQPGGMPAMQMVAGQPCDGMDMAGGQPVDPEQPVLCHQHCANAPQSFDGVQVPAVSLPAVVQVLVVRLLPDAGANPSVVFARAGEERPPPDPLFLSTLRLRV